MSITAVAARTRVLAQAQAQKEVTAKQAADQSAPPLDAPAPPRQP